NTAAGAFALSSNTVGTDNTAIGTAALLQNTEGESNTVAGSHALLNNTLGAFNTAVGTNALQHNTAGGSNTAIGASALAANTGSRNIALGTSAGSIATSGDDNIYIGHLGVAAEAATIRIGDPAVQTDRTFIAGISGANSASGVAVFVNGNGRLGTTTSARRFKEDIRDMGEASAGLLRLHPVTFRYRPEYDDGAGLLQYGLIAEE